MLPATGFFKNIECPFHEENCDRPYCHFRHRKKNFSEPLVELPIEPTPSTSILAPTYNPTPKSQLARNAHIPILYVPDLAGLPRERPFRFTTTAKPVYNPTPLSVLSNKEEAAQVQAENIPKYDPGGGCDSPDIEINFEELSSEFDLIDEIIDEGNLVANSTTNGSESTRICDNSEVEKVTVLEDKSVSVSKDDDKPKSESKEKKLKPKEKLQSKHKEKEDDLERQKKHSRSDSKSNAEELKRKQTASDKHKNIESESKTKLKSVDKAKIETHAKHRKRKDSSGDKFDHVKPSKRSKSESTSESEVKSNKDKLESSKKSKSKSEAQKNRKRKGSSSDDSDDDKGSKRAKHNESGSDSDSKPKKGKSTSKDKAKTQKISKHKKRKDSSGDDSDNDKHSKSSKKRNSSDLESKSKKGKKLDSKQHKSEKHKSKDKLDDRHKEKKQKSESVKTKSNEKRKDERRKSKSDDKHKSKRGSDDKHQTSKHKEDKKLKSSEMKPNPKITEELIEEVEDYSDYYSDNDNIDNTMEECFKIFSEYNPAEPELLSEAMPSQPAVAPIIPSKKRIAHESATQPKLTYTKPKIYPTPAQIMMNRFKTIRSSSEIDEQSEIIAEINKHVAKTPTAEKRLNALDNTRIPIKKPHVEKPTSLVDDILNGRTTIPSKRRIAPVLNAGLLQKAKAQIDEMAKMKINKSVVKTTMQTVLKGSKRVAHVVEQANDVPDVLEVERSKLPVNVRSRFLKLMAEECVQLYYSKEEAYERAVNEEFKVYERCGVLLTYRNSAMLAINRLRKERQERDRAGLDMILPGEVLTSSKHSSNPLDGNNFYNNIIEYVLSEDDLILHGFPRESSTPGHASIKSNRNKPLAHNLSENDRICARCLKHYQVDDLGFALYEEECLYHPLKKRTFRGESIYLCCKSSDEGGCVTSNTHVSDGSEDCEGYQMTMSTESESDPRSYAVYALDCEMCYTTRGLELTRVTIVNSDCKTVYETLVKPLNPIIDYNTRFSGITKEQMERTATSILQVQANILHLCNSKTILIGHSLESDMKALKIIHSSVIDTSVLFPHKFGLPHKRALRDLAREYLKKIIQNDISGHDSAEDALTCMELVQWKVKENCKYGNKS